MSRISKTFERLSKNGEGALIGYLTLGDPDIQTSKKLLKCLCKNVDILEIGIPFSDPIADGPTIQAAMDRALGNGVTMEDAFKVVSELRSEGVQTPFVFMTYYNIVLQYGEERFIKMCNEKGVDGLLVSDLPLEESQSIVEGCKKYGIDPIFLIAPTTPEDRVKKIVAQSKGFVYLISLLGVTGERASVQDRTLQFVASTLQLSGGLPLVVGFGISKKEHVKAIIAAGAQGIVVGSAFVNIIAIHGVDACVDLERLSKDLKEGTR